MVLLTMNMITHISMGWAPHDSEIIMIAKSVTVWLYMCTSEGCREGNKVLHS